MSDTVIQVDNLSKKYRLGVLGTGTLRHDFNRWLHRVRGKPDPYAKVGLTPTPANGHRASANNGHDSGLSDDEMWALRGVSFEVKQGEILGIIGRNGAGKSTLLKILSRVTAPTGGEVRVKGRIASLLEVGTGFHPELTGRENIFLNGAILGMTRAEIKGKFDEIVAFAEIEKFIDTPVKRYSSGMYVRLAFAVAAHLDPEILIVDEVLAVGDVEFQKKCLGKMENVSRNEGRTVLFVSHNTGALRSLCRRGLVLALGEKQFDGPISEAIDFYSANGSAGGPVWNRPPVSKGRTVPPMVFDKISLLLAGRQPHLKLQCDMTLRCLHSCARSFVAVDLLDSAFTPIMQALPELRPFIDGLPGLHRIQLDIDLPSLIPGVYRADFWVGSHYTTTLDWVRHELTFEITDAPGSDRTFPYSASHGSVVSVSRYIYSPPHATTRMPEVYEPVR